MMNYELRIMNYEMRLPFRSVGIALLSLCLFFYANVVLAQPDSVVISGRVLNLTARLYREAPTITFTRNNILKPQSELTRLAPLQADGSFTVTMPLIYPQEEVYLDYGGKVYTTFLAAPGSLELTFDADSMYKAKRLFYFAGVNAEANNQYIQFMTEEGRLMKDNKRFGEAFFETFWDMDADDARRALQRRADLRMSALLPVAQKGGVSPALREWVEAIVSEEQLSALYEHALVTNTEVNKSTEDSLRRLALGVMTFQRVQWVIRFGDYADRLLEKRIFQNPTRAKSLRVETMAELIKRYVKPLSGEETARLNDMIQQGSATSGGLDFLNTLYARDRRTMDLVTMIEKKNRSYADEFGQTATDLLSARLLVQRFYQSSLSDQELLYDYIKTKIEVPAIGQSLNELYQLEVKDSLYIRLIDKRTDITDTPTEVLSGIWLSQSRGNGKDWIKKIEKMYEGKTLYVLKWSLFDDQSRNEVLYAPALRAQLPADVEFLYVHLPNSEMVNSPSLWKKFIIRNKLKGVHMFVTDSQAVQLMFKLNPLANSTYGIIAPNGKYYSRNAPGPSNGQRAAQAILDARGGR